MQKLDPEDPENIRHRSNIKNNITDFKENIFHISMEVKIYANKSKTAKILVHKYI